MRLATSPLLTRRVARLHLSIALVFPEENPHRIACSCTCPKTRRLLAFRICWMLSTKRKKTTPNTNARRVTIATIRGPRKPLQWLNPRRYCVFILSVLMRSVERMVETSQSLCHLSLVMTLTATIWLLWQTIMGRQWTRGITRQLPFGTTCGTLLTTKMSHACLGIFLPSFGRLMLISCSTKNVKTNLRDEHQEA